MIYKKDNCHNRPFIGALVLKCLYNTFCVFFCRTNNSKKKENAKNEKKVIKIKSTNKSTLV